MATKVLFMTRLYSLRKSREILHSTYAKFSKKKKTLSSEYATAIENDMRALEQAIDEGDRAKADSFACRLTEYAQQHLKKSPIQFVWELIIAIIIALVIAVVVRQMWFEPYEIPTGSMRPSFKEQDHVAVTKTAFGLNVPLETKHFIFDPDLVKRAGVVIFSGDGIALSDTNTTYFGIFPYKKRYVKRLIGKPGDILYFYGGKIYGVDANGNPIKELLEDPWMKKIEHIPFLSFEGEKTFFQNNQIVFRQMNIPVGKYQIGLLGSVKSEIFDGTKWIKEDLFSQKKQNTINAYGSRWGIDNFAMARLLTPEQLESVTSFKASDVGEGILYLELRHHPNLTYPAPRITREGLRAQVSTFTTIIPLQERHLKAIFDNLYTARFVVKNGRATRYDAESSAIRQGSPHLPNIPNGTYEFYFGKAQEIGWKGWATMLPKNHPLYQFDPARVQFFFNLGIDMDTHLEPQSEIQSFPHRYAYFFDGDFYLMGAPILKKDDPVLVQYLAKEATRANESTPNKPYLPFIDNGPPLKNGEIDKTFITNYGLKVPEKHYLVLGDNHAMSADSRVFGFVPENNLQGAPSWILWPPGPRWGSPPQTPYPLITLPRLIVWGIFISVILCWYLWHRRKLSKKLFS